MTDRDLLETLRGIKVAQQMVYSRAFIDYLIAEAEDDQTAQESPERTKRIVSLMTSSHVEVINALGHLDERLRVQQEWANKLAAEIGKRKK